MVYITKFGIYSENNLNNAVWNTENEMTEADLRHDSTHLKSVKERDLRRVGTNDNIF